MKSLTKLLPIALFSIALFSCSNDDNTNNLGNNKTSITITDFVRTNENYSLLASALETTGLDTLLSDPNTQFTVFAPNNESLDAFLKAKGFSNGLTDIDTDEEIALVKNILENHVIAGSEFKANAIINTAPNYIKNAATGPKDLAGGDTNLSMLYTVVEGKVMINGSTEVTVPNAFDANNGIIHAVDKVIDLPLISTFATADARLSKLVTALTDANLVTTVDELDPATVFAPTNDAFGKLAATPTGGDLSNVLTYHVIADVNVVSTDVIGIIGQETPATVQGQNIDIIKGPAIKGKGNTESSGLVILDVQAINGVVHVIDTLLLPTSEM